MRVAITRAAPENERTAERLRALGAEPVLAPLLTIEPCAFDTDISRAQAVLFTSTNGVAAFARSSADRTAKVLTVGDASALAARAAGFADVTSADGDVIALAALARKSLDPAAGPLVHIAGDHVAGDLNTLKRDGFAIERRLAYRAIAAAALPEALKGPLDVLLFHSPRAAQAFLDLGAPGAESVKAGCLSPAVAEIAAKAGFAALIVAPRPREDALLTALLPSTSANA